MAAPPPRRSPFSIPWLLGACLSLQLGCSGKIDKPGDGDPGDSELSDAALSKLSTLQYRNTLVDLLGHLEQADLSSSLDEELAGLPIDGNGSSFAMMDRRISQRHIDSYYAVADKLSRELALDSARLSAIAGSCATAVTVDTTCFDAFMAKLGRLAFRRPLEASELARYREIAMEEGEGAEVYRSLVFGLLMAPQFLYHFEIGGQSLAGGDGLLALTDYELASRLSYHFWQTMPDSRLLSMAEEGSLTTDQGYLVALDMVMEDSRTQDTVWDFFSEWYGVGGFRGFSDTARFRAFAEGENIGEDGHDHYADMEDEIRSLVHHYAWDEPGSYRDLLQSDLMVSQSSDLARLYGVEAWDGVSAYPRIPAEERSGLLTRSAFLVSGEENTGLIHRGAGIRKKILCDPVTPPDPNSLPPGSLDLPPPSTTQTSRELYAAKTSSEECQACHKSFNPIGFVLEGYDALGRRRTEERIFDEEGTLLASLAINSTAVPEINFGETAEVSTGSELSRLIAESGKADSCFAKHYFRFAYRRKESNEDASTLASIEAALGADGSIQDALRAVALDSAFFVRKGEAQ